MARRAPSQYELRFLQVATGATRVLTRFESPEVQGLTVSPDRRTFLFGSLVNFNDDLMLIDGFK